MATTDETCPATPDAFEAPPSDSPRGDRRQRAREMLANQRQHLDRLEDELTDRMRQLADEVTSERSKHDPAIINSQRAAEMEELRRQLDEAGHQLTARQASLEQARADAQEARSQIARLEEDLLARQASLHEAQAHHEKRRIEWATLQEDLADAQAQLKAARTRQDELRRELAIARERPDGSQVEFDAQQLRMSRELKAQHSEQLAEIERAKAELRRLEATRASLQVEQSGEQAAENADAAAALSEAAAARHEAATARSEAVTARNEVVAARGEAAAARSEAAAAQAEVAIARDEAETAKSETTSARTELSSAKSALSAARHEASAAKTEATEAREQVEELRGQVTERVEALERIRRQMAEQKTEVAEARQQVEDLQSQIAERTEALERARKHAAEVKNEVAEARGKVEELEAQLEEKGEALERSRRQVAELKNEVGKLRGEIEAAQAGVAQAEAEKSDTVDLADYKALESDRDRLAKKLSAAEAKLSDKSESGDDSRKRGEQQRRFELAVEEVRELKRANAELEAKLAKTRSSGGSAPSGTVADTSTDWESQKRRLLASLEADERDDEPAITERATIEGTIRITDQIIAQKDQEIAELKRQLDEQGQSVMTSAGAAAVADVLDHDEVIRQEREKLQQAQAEWREKIGKAEIDISVERAKIARDRAELEERIRHYQEEHDLHPNDGEMSDGHRPQRGRWLARLGLKDQEDGAEQ